jgi:hypothetical protein
MEAMSKTRRDIYLIQSKASARRLSRYVLWFGGAALLVFAIDGPKFLYFSLLGVAVYFGVGALLNLSAVARHSKLTSSEANGVFLEVPLEDELERVTLKDNYAISVCGDPNDTVIVRAASDLIAQLRTSPDTFLREVEDFRIRNANMYPGYKNQLLDLQVRGLNLFRVADGVVCKLVFGDDISGVWEAEFDAGRISDLIWL